MSRINLLHYVLLGMPVVLFFLSLILVMGQGKKDFMGIKKENVTKMIKDLSILRIVVVEYQMLFSRA